MRAMEKAERKTLRLKSYDYSQNGAYFVTICTQNRAPYFETVGADTSVRPYRKCFNGSKQ